MFLLSIGADVNIQAKNGCTAFDMASLIGNALHTQCNMQPCTACHIMTFTHSLTSASEYDELNMRYNP